MAEISTEDAVEQLHQMFSDFDKTALATVLEAHGGHVERTVEHLLSNPQAASGGGGGGGGGGGNGGGGASRGTDHDAALALQLSREWSDEPTNMPPPPVRPQGIPTPYGVGGGGGGGGGGGAGGIFAAERGSSMAQSAAAASRGGGGGSGGSGDRRGRRVALPEQFLRTPGWTGGGAGEVSSDPQVAADAKLAMMLQNEAFQRELQSHPDLAYLGRGSRSGDSRGNAFGMGGDGPSIKEQMTSMGNDIRRKVDELAVRWKMKDPGRADQTTEYSSVPLMSSVDDDADDQAEVVHFSQNNATRRTSSGGSAAGVGVFRADSAGEEQLGERGQGDRHMLRHVSAEVVRLRGRALWRTLGFGTCRAQYRQERNMGSDIRWHV
ncbi:unnamed protein product [Ectocarpus sp. 12 AP-2014]